jgi:hypothetical protein
LGSGIILVGKHAREPQSSSIVAIGIGAIGVSTFLGDTDGPGRTDDRLFDRLAIHSKRETGRQHNQSKGRCNLVPERPPFGSFRRAPERHLQGSNAALQGFGFPVSAKPQSWQEPHVRQPCMMDGEKLTGIRSKNPHESSSGK